MIETIFFDAAGTLFHLPRGVGWHYRAVALRHGRDLPEASLDRAFRSVWRETPARPSSRRRRPDDDRDWWRAVVDRVLDRCGTDGDSFDRGAYFAELYEEFTQSGVWALYPEVEACLRQLRPRFRLGIISNFDGRLRPILHGLGVAEFFDPVIISSEVGADKPDRWIFEQGLQRAAVAPGAALHVGDDPVCDWQGAAAAGLDVFRLDRTTGSLWDLVARLTAPTVS